MVGNAIRAAAVAISVTALPAAASEPQCYDAKVRARPIDQIPSDIGDCGPDCIVMSWPWFVELDVRRVIDGVPPGKRIRALVVQHTYVLPRESLWLLRRNSAGGYNVVLADDVGAIRRCSAGTAPVRPHIGTDDGRTLDELRDAAIRRYGHFRK